jgi:hypothetical protein
MRLGDARLQRRLEFISKRVRQAPERSFPKLFADDTELEGTYRFLNNARVDPNAVLSQHIEETLRRASGEETVLVLHDTTTFSFGGECDRDEVGSIDGNSPGFLGHFALAVTPGEARKVLGIVGMEPTFRLEPLPKVHWRKRQEDPSKESLRWPRLVDTVAGRVGQPGSLLHVMDAEGDSFEFFAHLVGGNHRFVIRAAHEGRRVVGEHESLAETLAVREPVACRRTLLGPRTRKASQGRSRHEPRESRVAKLEVQAMSVSLRRPERRPGLPAQIALNVVHVYEVDAADGADPVDWKLYTSEPIDTPERILAIVDAYRSRWVIEEFFKALKSGCAYEKRQLESRHALLNALAILAPIAVQLLVLRNEARSDEKTPTSLTERQIKVLRAVGRRPLPKNPTARELMLAVAGLGGHIKNNGEPGWQVLGRGFADLRTYELGWVAAQEANA